MGGSRCSAPRGPDSPRFCDMRARLLAFGSSAPRFPVVLRGKQCDPARVNGANDVRGQLADLLRMGPTAFLLGIALLLIGATLALRVSKWLARQRRVRRAARAGLAERAAAEVLMAAGYCILAYQVRQDWSVWADGEEVSFGLVADYLVEHQGQRWIAEVKTGHKPLDLRYGPTRRQLLEYRHAFGVAGVLLVDAEARRVRRIQFRQTAPAQCGSAVLYWLALGLLLGGALGRYWPR